jgi:hypothetical protein
MVKRAGIPAQVSSSYKDVMKKSKYSTIVKKLAKIRGNPVPKGKSKKVSMRDV